MSGGLPVDEWWITGRAIQGAGGRVVDYRYSSTRRWWTSGGLPVEQHKAQVDEWWITGTAAQGAGGRVVDYRSSSTRRWWMSGGLPVQ
ncbi:unnamed protein product [Phytophthora fragariaefolia]|uniref:Unnamed protein product n=1 Tax=Phytophthora fragariaefolia TaxID=1490495 RepID=A0A9W6YNF9_9STRA|nr:unnamed protein product [Phytophthora fragariaefolia]